MITVDGTQVIFLYEHIAVIYNPFAGGLRGKKVERLNRAVAALEVHGRKVSRHPTTAPRTAGAIARACIVAGADLIVSAGGDGTLNEVVGGMLDSAVPLAVLPAGTANVLANEVGLGSGMEQAARRIPECMARRVPLGRLEFADGLSQYFLLMAGAGLDAKIVFDLDQGLKARIGKAAYWICGFAQFGRTLEQFRVVADGKAHDCSFALISKVRNYGGDMQIASEVSLLDEQFEVVLFHGSNSYRYFLYLAAVAAKQHRRVRGVEVYRASELQLLPRDGGLVHLQVDGEYAGLLPANVKMSRDSVTVLIPAGYPPG
jgi:diacylglycerol kinase (ATP)